jgi:hypothetical protein
LEGGRFPAKLGRDARRDRELLSRVIARSEATKQFIVQQQRKLDCFASLAMTIETTLALLLFEI